MGQLTPGERQYYLGTSRQCILFLDTNILMDAPDLGSYNAGYPQVVFVVLEAVISEISGLRNSPDAELRSRASRAYSALEPLLRRQGRAVGLPVGRYGHHLRIPLEPATPREGVAVDQLLVDRAAEEQRRRPDKLVALVTRDEGVCAQARAVGVRCVRVHGRFDNRELQKIVRDLREGKL